MTYDELNDGQRAELKQRILEERDNRHPDGPSWGELANAGETISDEEAREWAEGMEFSEDDFTCSCHGRTVKVERIPQWAVCYLVNADDSALTPEDRKLVDDYVERLLKKEHLRLLGPIDGTENGFSSHPAFGLPCETVDFAAEELRDGESD